MNKIRIDDEWSFFALVPALLWQILFLVVPVGLIILLSCVYFVGYTPVVTGSFFAHVFKLAYIRIIIFSLFMGLFTASLSLFIGYPTAYFLAFYVKDWLKNVLLFLLILPFWTNFLIHVYAWFFMLKRDGLLNDFLFSLGFIKEPLHLFNNLFAVSLVMLYCYIPFMVLPLYTVLEKIDPSLLEASQDLGASSSQTFFKVVFPLSIAGVLTGFILVFVPSFGEFVIPLLVGGEKYALVGSVIQYLFLSARDMNLGAAFTCLSSIILLLSIACIYILFNKKIIK